MLVQFTYPEVYYNYFSEKNESWIIETTRVSKEGYFVRIEKKTLNFVEKKIRDREKREE